MKARENSLKFLRDFQDLRVFLAPDDRTALILPPDQNFFLRAQIFPEYILLKPEKSTRPANLHQIKMALKVAKNSFCNAKFQIFDENFRNLKKPAPDPKNPYFLDEFLPDFAQNLKNYALEIGFGSGRHILSLAQNFPQTIFIGAEIHRPSIAKILRQIELRALKNLYIINANCRELVKILPKNCRAIFLHFPVPWPKNPHRRVFCEEFLQDAAQILKPGHFLHLRTDDLAYFSQSFWMAHENFRIKIRQNTDVSVVSKYESRWKKQQKNIFDLYVFASGVPKNLQNFHEIFAKDPESTEILPQKFADFSFPEILVTREKLKNLCRQKFFKNDVLVAINSVFFGEKSDFFCAILGSRAVHSTHFVEISREKPKMLKYMIAPRNFCENLRAHEKLIEILHEKS